MLLLLLQAESSFAAKSQMEQIATNSEAAQTPDLDLAASSQLSSWGEKGSFILCVRYNNVSRQAFELQY